MENASKALLIAAAILIAIILISLGLVAINQGREVIDEAGSGVSDVAVTAFNGKFSSYLGNNKSGADAKALISAVKTNNSVNSDDDSKKIDVVYKTSEADEGNKIILKDANGNDVISQVIGSGKAYKIQVEDQTKAGYISEISIIELGNK